MHYATLFLLACVSGQESAKCPDLWWHISRNCLEVPSIMGCVLYSSWSVCTSVRCSTYFASPVFISVFLVGNISKTRYITMLPIIMNSSRVLKDGYTATLISGWNEGASGSVSHAVFICVVHSKNTTRGFMRASHALSLPPKLSLSTIGPSLNVLDC